MKPHYMLRFLTLALVMLAGCVSQPAVGLTSSSKPTTEPTIQPTPMPEYNIVTLLPPDAIPAIDDPRFLSAEEADAQYGPAEMVLGVEIDGDARAYSIPHLSAHEIVNDTVGGRPIAVTW